MRPNDLIVIVPDGSPLTATMPEDANRLIFEGCRTIRGLIAGLQAAGHARRRGTLHQAARAALIAAGHPPRRGAPRR